MKYHSNLVSISLTGSAWKYLSSEYNNWRMCPSVNEMWSKQRAIFSEAKYNLLCFTSFINRDELSYIKKESSRFVFVTVFDAYHYSWDVRAVTLNCSCCYQVWNSSCEGTHASTLVKDITVNTTISVLVAKTNIWQLHQNIVPLKNFITRLLPV